MKRTFKKRLAAVLAAVTAAACLPGSLWAVRTERKAVSDAYTERVGTVEDAKRTFVLGGGRMKMRVCSVKRCMLRRRICWIRTASP